MGNPTDQQHFNVLLANAARRMKYQRLLWRKLRAVMAEGRRDQGGDWSSRYVDLLERAARHQQRIERTKNAGFMWIDTRRMKSKPPKLRVIPR